MKTTTTMVACIGLMLGGAAMAAEKPAATDRVDVTFVDREKFTDVKDDALASDSGRDYILQQLKDHLVRTAVPLLANGQHLEVRVTDVDLAGDINPRHGPSLDHVRFMTDIYPPRMELEFKLTDASGAVVSEGKRHLVELSYLYTISAVNSDPLRYDKALITDWLRRELRRPS